MPESDEKCKGCMQPNWVDKLTLVVLAATWITVVIYTHVSSKILDADTRPYIGVSNMGSDIPGIDFDTDRTLMVPIIYVNSGKLPADAHIKATVLPSEIRLSDGPNLTSIKESHDFIWPPPIINRMEIRTGVPLTDGQAADLNNGHYPWLYIAIQILYGSHHTDICWEYPISSASQGSGNSARHTARLTDYALCQNRAANDAN